MANVSVIAAGTLSINFNGAAARYNVRTPGGVLYLVYVDINSDVAYIKSSDGGLTWGTPVSVFAGTVTQLSIWYDRWSNISAGLIHCAYTESVTDDVKYRSINTESSDTLSTETTIFAGVSTNAGGALSITRARGGNLGCVFNIDGGAEDGFSRSTDVGATWGARADPTEAATQDQYILLPGWAADNQDMMLYFWDASADEISQKLYDDSADSWAETSIATTMVDTAATVSFPHFAASVDIANSRNLLVAWTAVDLANADLRCWHITESTITEVTNVVLNSTDDQGMCAIGIDTDTEDWYVFYAGKSDGSEIFDSNAHIYYKKSTDDGATWGSETVISTAEMTLFSLWCIPRFATHYLVGAHIDSSRDLIAALFSSSAIPSSAGGIAALVGGSLVR